MKKILVLLMAVIVTCTVFAACSKSGGSDKDDSKASSASVTQIETEKAKIKENDAVKYIESSYSKKELGLDGTDKDYHLMVASSGVEIDGKKYVKVVANVPIKNDVTNKNGQETFTMETLGEYFISFDGKKVLMKNMENDEYTELENRYDAYSEKGKTENVAEKAEEKK